MCTLTWGTPSALRCAVVGLSRALSGEALPATGSDTSPGLRGLRLRPRSCPLCVLPNSLSSCPVGTPLAGGHSWSIAKSLVPSGKFACQREAQRGTGAYPRSHSEFEQSWEPQENPKTLQVPLAPGTQGSPGMGQ